MIISGGRNQRKGVSRERGMGEKEKDRSAGLVRNLSYVPFALHYVIPDVTLPDSRQSDKVPTGVEKSLFSLGIIDPVTTRMYTWCITPMRQTPRVKRMHSKISYCWPMPLKLNDLVTVYTSSWPKPPNIVLKILKKIVEGSSAERVNGSSRLATALSASSRPFLLMLVGSVPHRELSWSGEPCHPPTTPTPWSSRSPGSLPPPNVVPPRRQLPLVLPPTFFGINDNFICLIENIWRDMVFALDLEENIVAWMHVKLDGAFNSTIAVPRIATGSSSWCSVRMLRHYTAAVEMAPMPLFQNEISLYRKRCRRMFFRVGTA
ncbi:hypothetical protein ALC62_15066 [Cyphomyrmex costatus]|uniref:Uncharacterized protein n=1 Tax=Cyphomyrmex costatus TaxID=456900 RepID=A0A151I843_9HYME|nr:hypothetical protein ALC62_15066 [Cyphomyrmex costatus]